jgi:hypothetical protein
MHEIAAGKMHTVLVVWEPHIRSSISSEWTLEWLAGSGSVRRDHEVGCGSVAKCWGIGRREPQ